MAAQLALKMDINLQHNEEASTMVEEYAYMDAMHTRVKGYKTLTLSLCEKLCYTYTKHDYTKVSNALENLCEQNDIGNWWSWWDVRHFHIVPAFWGFNISGLNLVKTGHSAIKTRSVMPLTVAAWMDICLMMLQDRDYEAHMSNTGKVSGKGMNLK